MRAFFKLLLSLILLGAVAFGGYEIYLRVSNFEDLESKKVFELPIYDSSLALSWEHIPGAAYADYAGEDLKINKLGFRDNEPEEDKEIVLMLGDGFTFGVGTAQSKIFNSLLDEEFRNIDFWNGGVIGYAANQYVAYLNKNLFSIAVQIKPKLVVFNMFVGDDITDLASYDTLTEANYLPEFIVHKRVFVDEQGFLREINFDPDVSLVLQKAQVELFGKLEEGLLSNWSAILPGESHDRDIDFGVEMNKFKDYLVKVDEILENEGIEFLVVMIPMDVQVSQSYWSKYNSLPFDTETIKLDLPQTDIIETFEEEGIEYLDLLPEFRESERMDEIYMEADIYLSEYGHELVAEVLSGKVEEILSK